jgi:hypothetical protein
MEGSISSPRVQSTRRRRPGITAVVPRRTQYMPVIRHAPKVWRVGYLGVSLRYYIELEPCPPKTIFVSGLFEMPDVDYLVLVA